MQQQLTQITPGLYMVPDRWVQPQQRPEPAPAPAADPSTEYPAFYRSRYVWHNIAIAADDSTATLIDTGVPGSVPQIEQALGQLGLTLSDVKRVIITHAHVDHMGSMREILERTGAELCCHEIEAPYLMGQKIPPTDHREFQPAERVDVLLKDGDVLDVLGGAEVLFTPGHTAGHICLYLRRGKVLVASGLVRYKDGWFDLTPPQLSSDYPDLLRSMRRVARLDFDILFPYQGDILFENAAEKYRRLVSQLEAIGHLFRPEISEALTTQL